MRDVVKLATLLMVISPVAYAKTFKLDKVQLRTGVKADVVEAEKIKARVFGFNIGVKVEDKFSKRLKFFFDMEAQLETGSNQVVGTIAEYEPKESINLEEGGIEYRPFRNLTLKGGALNQGHHASPLLVGATTFAGVEEKLKLGIFYFKATQAIPSNNKLTKRLGNVDDGTPYFGMESIGIKVGKTTSFQMEVGHYAFKDLSSSIANNSRELGNSIKGVGEASEFNYDFNGVNSTINFKHSFGNGFAITLGGQYLYNDKAPTERNTGYLAYTEMGVQSFSVLAEGFENESDTSPAFYNSKAYGHSNMRGASLGIKSSGKDFSFVTKYTQAKVIDADLVQNEDMDLITINLVRTYEF